jgi:hypothetical protein
MTTGFLRWALMGASAQAEQRELAEQCRSREHASDTFRHDILLGCWEST